MVTNVRRMRFKYAPGTVVDSCQVRRIRGTSTDITLDVGAQLTIPNGFEKIIISDHIGGAALERVFVRIPHIDTLLVPVYVKIYDGSVGPVVLFLNGIAALRVYLTGKHREYAFLKDTIYKCTLSELYCLDPQTHDLLVSLFDMPQLSSRISNDSTSPWNTGGELRSSGYPWDTTALLSHPLEAELLESTEPQPKSIASEIHDLFLQVRWYDRGEGNRSLLHAVSDHFKVEMGERYEPYALDPLTRMCTTHSGLTRAAIRENSGIVWPKVVPHTEMPIDGCELPTQFSSAFLSFCVWLHQLPFFECGFVYTLPSRTSPGALIPEKFVWKYAKLRTRDTFTDWQILQIELSRLTRFWDTSVFHEIEVHTTAMDEALIILRGESAERRLYVDLTLTSLLSQSVATVL